MHTQLRHQQCAVDGKLRGWRAWRWRLDSGQHGMEQLHQQRRQRIVVIG
jgi:hypothetical protein